MRVLSIVGSMRMDGYTNQTVNTLIHNLRDLNNNINSEIIYISEMNIQNCRVTCSNYCINNNFKCALADDVPIILKKMIEADALIIGTPLYFRAPPAKFHMFVERLVSMFFFHESTGNSVSPLSGKPSALIGVAEYSNPAVVLEYLTDFCNVLQLRPLRLGSFPYTGIAWQGDGTCSNVFRQAERSREMARLLLEQI